MSKTEQAAIDAAKPQQPATVTVQLESPIVRGEQKIDALTLRKPGAGELRGLQLTAVVNADVNSLLVLLPRITTPTLTNHDVMQMDPVDLAAIGGEVVGFFMSRREKAALSPTA